MKILVSACLLGQACKYDGGSNLNEAVLAYCEGHEVVPVCPEVAGGLPVPRCPCEIANGAVVNSRGENVDAAFRAGAEACLRKAADEGISLAILQPRSPSCGVHQVYDGTFSGRLTEGSGVFADLLMRRGFKVLDADDIKALLQKESG